MWFKMSKKYVATRKDVCAGQLLKTGGMFLKVYDSNNNEISKDKFEELGISKISFSCGLVCRGMLFNVNEFGLANDLIYTTPTNYPIEGVEPKFSVESDFIIGNYVELEGLLKYLKYGVDLTQRDLDQIYKKFITHNWWLEHHAKLFGCTSFGDGSYGIGGFQTVSQNIYENLSRISFSKDGKPYQEEPGYSRIKKRK